MPETTHLLLGLLCLWAVVTVTGLAPLTMVNFTREPWWCWWPVHRWYGGPPGGLCPCYQWTDENGTAPRACTSHSRFCNVRIRERGRHLGRHQRDVVFLVDVVSMSFRWATQSACRERRRPGCAMVCLVRSPCKLTVYVITQLFQC